MKLESCLLQSICVRQPTPKRYQIWNIIVLSVTWYSYYCIVFVWELSLCLVRDLISIPHWWSLSQQLRYLGKHFNFYERFIFFTYCIASTVLLYTFCLSKLNNVRMMIQWCQDNCLKLDHPWPPSCCHSGQCNVSYYCDNEKQCMDPSHSLDCWRGPLNTNWQQLPWHRYMTRQKYFITSTKIFLTSVITYQYAQMYGQHKTHLTIPNTYLLTVIQLSILSFFSYLSTNLLLGQALVP